ncbi:MAG: hypothetical protein GY810_22250 [Aureispira sp.]|nr:hypothetical protein [Aureispira sp.]
MNNDLLDDGNIPKAPPKPNKILSRGLLLLGLGILAYKINSSETELVRWSYLFVPLLVAGWAAAITTPQKAILIGIVTVAIVFVFYQTLWSAL